MKKLLCASLILLPTIVLAGHDDYEPVSTASLAIQLPAAALKNTGIEHAELSVPTGHIIVKPTHSIAGSEMLVNPSGPSDWFGYGPAPYSFGGMKFDLAKNENAFGIENAGGKCNTNMYSAKIEDLGVFFSLTAQQKCDKWPKNFGQIYVGKDFTVQLKPTVCAECPEGGCDCPVVEWTDPAVQADVFFNETMVDCGYKNDQGQCTSCSSIFSESIKTSREICQYCMDEGSRFYVGDSCISCASQKVYEVSDAQLCRVCSDENKRFTYSLTTLVVDRCYRGRCHYKNPTIQYCASCEGDDIYYGRDYASFKKLDGERGLYMPDGQVEARKQECEVCPNRQFVVEASEYTYIVGGKYKRKKTATQYQYYCRKK